MYITMKLPSSGTQGKVGYKTKQKPTEKNLEEKNRRRKKRGGGGAGVEED